MGFIIIAMFCVGVATAGTVGEETLTPFFRGLFAAIAVSTLFFAIETALEERFGKVTEKQPNGPLAATKG